LKIILFIFSLFIGATVAAGQESEYFKQRRALGFIESRNIPSAKNKVTSASGKYQFMKAWDKFFQRECGVTWSSVVPSRKAPATVTARMSAEQDRLFDAYYREQVKPWIADVRRRGLGKKLADYELLALAHRQGTKGAELYLRTGRDPYNGKYGNRHVASHLKAMRKAMAFEKYLDSQTNLVGAKA